MQTLFRATVMLAALGAGVWALTEYGPKETIQPLARRAIELADRWLGEASDGQPPQPQAVAPLEEMPVTRLVAEPGRDDMTMVAAPPLAPADDPHPAAPTSSSLGDATPPIATTPTAEHAVLESLVELGLQNVRLSTWGREGRFHRISGEMPVAHHAGMSRHLEAVAPDPAAAAADLKRQVLAWQLRDQRLASHP